MSESPIAVMFRWMPKYLRAGWVWIVFAQVGWATMEITYFLAARHGGFSHNRSLFGLWLLGALWFGMALTAAVVLLVGFIREQRSGWRQ